MENILICISVVNVAVHTYTCSNWRISSSISAQVSALYCRMKYKREKNGEGAIKITQN